MAISKEQVNYTANLARIELTEDELNILSRHLDDIIKFIDKLKDIDIKEVAPCGHVIPIRNVFREDKAHKSLDVKDALQNAPAKENNFFKVPKVIE